MSDKKNKNSYADDTMQFSVPRQEMHKNPQNGGQRPPQGKNPQYDQQHHSVDSRQKNAAAYPQQRQEEQYHYNEGQGSGAPHHQSQRPQGQSHHQPNEEQQYQGQPHQQAHHRQQPHQQQSQHYAQNGQSYHEHAPQRPQQYDDGYGYEERRPQQKSRTQKKRRKKGGLVKKIIIGAVIFFAALFLIYSIFSFVIISKVNVEDSGSRIAPSHDLYSSSSVRNILLIGNDSRGDDRGRSDSMILLSVNSNTHKINLVSLMRDTYVDIPGYGSDRLNAAYSYGGPELLMDTIEENFYIDVDDYVSINFTSFAGLVDAVGGVEVEVSDDEAEAINALLDSPEGVSLFGQPKESDYLNGAGKYKLSGKQALSYSRLRKVGNADFERTERQRTVLTGIMKNMGVGSLFSLMGEAFPNVSTNMSKFDMYLLSLRLPWLLMRYDFEQLRIPAEGTYEGADIDGMSVLEIDVDANLDIVEDVIYGK